MPLAGVESRKRMVTGIDILIGSSGQGGNGCRSTKKQERHAVVGCAEERSMIAGDM